MNKVLLIVLSFTLLLSCNKQDEKISEPENISNLFFETYKQSGPKDALKRLLASNKYITDAVVDTVSNSLEKLVLDLGDLQGIEKITEVSYGKGLVQLAYLVKYSQQPLRFNFTFYQPGNGWRVQNFSYESDFLDELDELVKANKLND